MRLFFAVELPAEACAAAAELRGLFPADHQLRWVEPALMHVTLAFMGEQPESALPALEHAGQSAGRTLRPFTLGLGGTETFGPRTAPSAYVLGLSGDVSALRDLQGRLSEELRAAAFSLEERSFRPHITLARTRSGRNRPPPTPLTVPRADLAAVRFSVSDFVLMHSQLGRGSPVYTPLARFQLAPMPRG